MSKLGNILTMLKLLETGKKYSVKELSDILEVTPRMIRVYKSDLEQAGIYIESLQGIYGGYVYNKKHHFNISFDLEDIKSLEQIILNYNLQKNKNLEMLLEKIKKIVIYSNYDAEARKTTDESNKKYNIISKAILNNSRIKMKYKSTVLDVKPQSINFYKNLIFITMFLVEEQVLRTYSIDEIILI